MDTTQEFIDGIAQEVLAAVRTAWECLKPHLPEDRKGGYLYVGYSKTEDATASAFGQSHVLVSLLYVLVGQVPLGKAEKYEEFSAEKAVRLRSHPDHFSSWQSRNPERERWGGAIRAKDRARGDQETILSFSGLPELADEALMLLTAVNLKWLTVTQAAEIAIASKNQFFRDALDRSRSPVGS